MHYYPDELMAIEAAPDGVTIPRPGIGLPLTILAAATAFLILMLAWPSDSDVGPVAPPTVVTTLVTQPTTAPLAPPATSSPAPTTPTRTTPVESVPVIFGGGVEPVIE